MESAVSTPDTSGGDVAPAFSMPMHDGVFPTGIAILGSNPATLDQAPFADPSWAIYACSPDNTPYGNASNAKALPRVGQWFEVHTPLEDPTRPFAYLKHISDAMPIVWIRDHRALKSGMFSGAREYPEKELRGTMTVQKVKFQNERGEKETRIVEIPNNDGMFSPWMFTSSIAYMLAKAIVDCEQHGIKQIGLWGIMQQSDNEYVYQRPGIQYFLGEAMKRGIKVVAPRESCLFDMPAWKW